MTFDEFLLANDEKLLMEAHNQASPSSPLPMPLHEKLTSLLRTFMLVGGMPEAVVKWVETHDYLQCQEVQDDIITGYEADFPKYKKKVDPQLLRMTMRSAAQQATKKFMYSQVPGEYKTAEVKKALELLIKANIIFPVTHTNSNGLPLGDGRDDGIRKMLLLDTGLMLRLLNMAMGNIRELTTHILTATAADLVNKGPMAEMLAGLELLHYRTLNLQYELFYWQRQAKNATAEVDYVLPNETQILPVEVKAGVQGGMKSLWAYMRERKLTQAIRCSLENFGEFDYIDDRSATKEDACQSKNGAQEACLDSAEHEQTRLNGKADESVRHVRIFPLYAIRDLIWPCQHS